MNRIITLLAFLAYMIAGQITSYAQEVLFSEDFNQTPGTLPTGWTNWGEQPSSWAVNNSQIGGGTAPELYMASGFQAGFSRLISPNINVSGREHLVLSYKQYIINFGADWGETIGMDVTFDGGANWNTIWERPLGLLNIPQDEFHYFISVPTEASQMQFAYRFEGNNNGINGWAIDDVRVETAVLNDLLATVIEGNTTPYVNHNNLLTVEVVNGGSASQNNYTVKIFSSENVELVSATGQPVSFGDKVYHQIFWAPSPDQMNIESIYATVEFTEDQNQDNNQSAPFYLKILPANTTYSNIGEGSFPLIHSSPYNFFTLQSLSQTLYKSSEIIVTNNSVIGIQYACQFDEDVNDVPIQIYLAETDQTNLSSGWLAPTNFTLVYDGMMDFKKGFNTLFITLDEAFPYTDKNLVVYSNKSHSEMVLWSTFLSTYNENGEFSRIVDGDGAPFNPMSPPNGYPVYYSPNITFFFNDGQMAVIDQNQTNASLYPNPATDVLNVQLDSNEIIEEIRIINSIGQTITTQKINTAKAEIDVRKLPSGYYLAQIITAKNNITKKFLVK